MLSLFLVFLLTWSCADGNQRDRRGAYMYNTPSYQSYPGYWDSQCNSQYQNWQGGYNMPMEYYGRSMGAFQSQPNTYSQPTSYSGPSSYSRPSSYARPSSYSRPDVYSNVPSGFQIPSSSRSYLMEPAKPQYQASVVSPNLQYQPASDYPKVPIQNQGQAPVPSQHPTIAEYPKQTVEQTQYPSLPKVPQYPSLTSDTQSSGIQQETVQNSWTTTVAAPNNNTPPPMPPTDAEMEQVDATEKQNEVRKARGGAAGPPSINVDTIIPQAQVPEIPMPPSE
ncbi:unnamed protein product [Caenorhabditis bovis]|uniref:Uncharacterized protein n=1 Tax=Caenorhabditis bovis TaxID=2654633 RepID=A0A8S1FBL5_9PELO|nr:unnamed protein product [Caenorhabditis bovis]